MLEWSLSFRHRYSSSRSRENQQPSIPGPARLRPICQTGLKAAQREKGQEEVTNKRQEASSPFLGGKEAENDATCPILPRQRDFSFGDVSNQASKLSLHAQEDGEGTRPPAEACH